MKKTAVVCALVWVLGLCAAYETLAATASDYTNAANWMSVPETADKSIDVFYLYPSAWRPAAGNTQTYADIDDGQMRAQAREFLEKTGGMFEHIANIYAPYYRQSNASKTLGMSLEEVEALTREVPGEDALAAFKYYLENYNQGRPFILVSHSQGSSTMKVGILGELIAQEPALLSQMIAAYTIGWTYTPNDLAAKGLRFAQGPDDTGVIIAWNTETPGVNAPNPVVYPGALVINPITWTTTDEYASASEGLGNNLPGEQGTDGQIDPNRGVIINTTQDPADYNLSPMFPYGSLHGVEWELYYYDVFQNVVTRSVSYYTPTYNAYGAALGNGQLGDFSGYLRALLEQNPNPGSVFFHPVHSIFFRLAGQPDDAAFKAEMRRVYSDLTPQATGQALVSLGGVDRAASGILRKQLRFRPVQGQAGVFPENPGWSVWAQPFYHSGTQKGDSLRTEIDADYKGISAGLVRRTENYAYGVGLHVGKGDFDGTRYDADVEGFGIGIGVTRRFRVNNAFNPELSLDGSYSRYSFEQKREVSANTSPEAAGVYESEPSAAFWSAGLFLGNDFAVTDELSLRPELGFDYLSAKMKSYRESGGELALSVNPERYESFRSSAGLALNWSPLDSLGLSLGGSWRHEFADENVRLRGSTRNLSAAAFSTRGRNLGRDSGTAEAGLEWRLPTSREASLAFDYAHTFSRSHRSNEINASFVLRF